ncbi:MAG: antitoxin [Tyzzerella sp.]|nr:antitoxin [Tyzzerella sp.]
MGIEKKSNCGRPAGRKKTAKIEISIEPTVKDEFMTLLHSEGKTASVEIGLWIRKYIKSSKLEGEE